MWAGKKIKLTVMVLKHILAYLTDYEGINRKRKGLRAAVD